MGENTCLQLAHQTNPSALPCSVLVSRHKRKKLTTTKSDSAASSTAPASSMSEIVVCELGPEPTASLMSSTTITMKQFTKTTEQVLKAETLRVLKAICSHYSFNNCEGISQFIATISPDSEMAKNFSCGADKAGYITAFGLGPHFQCPHPADQQMQGVRPHACHHVAAEGGVQNIILNDLLLAAVSSSKAT